MNHPRRSTWVAVGAGCILVGGIVVLGIARGPTLWQQRSSQSDSAAIVEPRVLGQAVAAEPTGRVREEPSFVRMRERITGQINAIANDSLRYVDDSSSEDRTDDFDREFALNLVSTEHDALYEIDDALRRVRDASYGRCDGCGCAIEKKRFDALPFARMCIKCQSDMERGQSRYRPFGETLSQHSEQAAETAEAEESE